VEPSPEIAHLTPKFFTDCVEGVGVGVGVGVGIASSVNISENL
jgi:hypothetical protein